MRRYRETGKVEAKPRSGGPATKLEPCHLSVIEQLVKAQPDALLSELCERFAERATVIVSASTMHRTVQQLKLSYKKTLTANEQETPRVQDLRFAHRDWTFTVDPRNLVFVDETGMHLGLTRLSGRAPKGERLYDTESPGKSGQNISLIGGISNDGLIATLSVVGSVNTDVFLFYIRTTVVDNFRELGNAYDSDGSERELDDVCARKTNVG